MFNAITGILALALLLSPLWVPMLLIWGFKYKFRPLKEVAYAQEVERTRDIMRRGEVDALVIRDAMRDESYYDRIARQQGGY